MKFTLLFIWQYLSYRPSPVLKQTKQIKCTSILLNRFFESKVQILWCILAQKRKQDRYFHWKPQWLTRVLKVVLKLQSSQHACICWRAIIWLAEMLELPSMGALLVINHASVCRFWISDVPCRPECPCSILWWSAFHKPRSPEPPARKQTNITTK